MKENYFEDIELSCICGELFIWTSGEQKFINDLCDRGKIDKVNQPKRCPACRKKKKEERSQYEGKNY